jgi:hypothetical protein
MVIPNLLSHHLTVMMHWQSTKTWLQMHGFLIAELCDLQRVSAPLSLSVLIFKNSGSSAKSQEVLGRNHT